MRRRRRRRRDDAVRSIRLRGGFGSLADGFGSLGEGMGRLMGVDVDDPDDGNGRWLYKRKPLHDCVLPHHADSSVGDAWQCSECGSTWIVVQNGDGLGMERVQTQQTWYPGQTTGTVGYGYTWTTPSSYWYSSETRTEKRKDDTPE